jgi:hypothetical protein
VKLIPSLDEDKERGRERKRKRERKNVDDKASFIITE